MKFLSSGAMSFMRRALSVVALAAITAGCANQSVNPATGRQERLSLTRADEQKLGDQEHPKILASMGGVYEDHKVTGYVAEIGGRLARNSEIPEGQWTFTVLDSPVVNAFALPGGYVYVTRGLLALANSEAELAGVLGHEIGHVTARHTAQRYDRARTASIFGVIATIGAAAAGIDPGAVGQAVNMAGRGYVASFSRDQELEADHLGVRYIARAGYDPYAQADFLESMQAQSALAARLKGKTNDPNQVDFFSTHPATADRTRAALDAAGATGGTVGAPRRRGEFLNAIDGMVYGDSRKEGFVRGRRFVHPTLQFEWEAPAGFELTNGSQAVRADGPNGARIIFTGGKGSGRSAAADLETWANALASKGQVGRLSGFSEFSTTDARGATGVVPVASRSGPVEARLIVLVSGTQTYRFSAVYPERMARQMDGPLREMAYSFRKIGRREASGERPYRMRVVTVQRGDTVRSIARRMPFSELAEERFRVLNGMRSGDRLRAGERVKIVVQ